MKNQTTLPDVALLLSHQNLLLEAILAELRFTRGMTESDLAFVRSDDADLSVGLSKLQSIRRDISG
jgi:hypothetical protein